MKKPVTPETSCQPQVELQLPLPLLSCLKAVREGFFELCVRVGEQALHALMEHDRTELCGTKWSRDASRRAVRGGSTASEITLGGRRIRVRRLRAAQVHRGSSCWLKTSCRQKAVIEPAIDVADVNRRRRRRRENRGWPDDRAARRILVTPGENNKREAQGERPARRRHYRLSVPATCQVPQKSVVAFSTYLAVLPEKVNDASTGVMVPQVGSVTRLVKLRRAGVKKPVRLMVPVTAVIWNVAPETVSEPVIVSCDPACTTVIRAVPDPSVCPSTEMVIGPV